MKFCGFHASEIVNLIDKNHKKMTSKQSDLGFLFSFTLGFSSGLGNCKKTIPTLGSHHCAKISVKSMKESPAA